MATNTCDAAGTLPDELLLDIFARLCADLVDILRCAATCTRWLRLLVAHDVAILRRAGVLLKKNRNVSILLGAFYQNDYLLPGSAATMNCPPRFWKLHDRTLPGSGLFSEHDDGLFNYARPLASRCGLLLARLMPAPLDYRELHLAVCHPLIGGVHLAPPPALHLHPPFQGRDVTGYALLPGYGGECFQDNNQRRLAFRVLFTAVRLDEVVYAYSYSSATGSWSVPIMCPLQLRHLTMAGPRAGIVDGRGTTHWLYRDTTSLYTLDISADAAHASLTKIPTPVPGYYHSRELQPQPPLPCATK